MRCFLVSLAVALPLGQALASPGLTTMPTTMYASAKPHARIVQAIPANAEIDVSGCDGGWCYASWRNRFGYVSARSVEATPEGYPDGEPYGPPPVVVAPYWGPGPYVGWGWGWGWRRW